MIVTNSFSAVRGVTVSAARMARCARNSMKMMKAGFSIPVLREQSCNRQKDSPTIIGWVTRMTARSGRILVEYDLCAEIGESRLFAYPAELRQNYIDALGRQWDDVFGYFMLAEAKTIGVTPLRKAKKQWNRRIYRCLASIKP